MGQHTDARLTPEIAREICERTASIAVIDGSIAKLGSQYVLGLRAKDCRTGNVLAEEQVQAAKKEEVLNALSQIASKFRSQVGESLTTVEKHNTPLAEATTPSLEALKIYSTGLKTAATVVESKAVPLYQHAIDIDPQFAMAYAELGLMYSAMGESALSAENSRKAYELRDRASDRERFFITASYDGRVTGNLEKAQQTCEAWAQTYPRQGEPHGYLGGFIYPASGRYERSVKEARKLIELEPTFAIGYSMLAGNLVALDRVDEAQSVLRILQMRTHEPLTRFSDPLRLKSLFGQAGSMVELSSKTNNASWKAFPPWQDWLQARRRASVGHPQHLPSPLPAQTLLASYSNPSW